MLTDCARKISCAVLTAWCVLQGTGTVVGGEAWRDGEAHYSAQLPEGWVKMEQSRIDEINEQSKKKYPNRKVLYHVGFVPEGKSSKTIPYILVQRARVDWKSKTYDDIEADLKRTQKEAAPPTADTAEKPDADKGEKKGDAADDPSRDLQTAPVYNSRVLDRAKNRIVSEAQVQTSQGELNHVTSYQMLGAGARVTFHYYATAETREKHLPAVESFVDSFAWEPGYEFVSGGAKPAPQMNLTKVIIAGCVALFAVLGAMVLKKRTAPVPVPAK